jgi:serine/threonine-protein kinase
MAELSDPRIGTLLEGRYRLDVRLAAGGMGVVYKGELAAIGKPVAIKFLHDALAAVPDLVKRFQREAQAMSRLAHPNIVSVIDSGLDKGVPFLVMDFVSGRSLADLLNDGALPATRAVALAKQILAAVKHAHGMGVVHRDLKPDNILLLAEVEGDFVKILDFGLAKVVAGGSGDSATQLTNTGFALGTPGYMSPEQARGTEADERSDLYAVGVILYHMVAGRKPFVADSPLAVLRMHMDDTPPPPSSVKPRCCSPELERVILRSMAKEPSGRFQKAADFAAALATTPEGSEVGFDLDSVVSERPRRPPFRIPRWAVRAAMLAVVVVTVTTLWSKLSHRAQQKVKRRIDDAYKMAQGAFEQAQQNPTVDPLHKLPPGKTPQKGEPPKVEAPKLEPPTPGPIVPGPAVPGTTPAPSATTTTTPPTTTRPEPLSPTAPSGEAAKPTPGAPSVTPPVPTPPPVTPPSSPLAQDDDDDDDDDDSDPVPPRDTPGAKLEEALAKGQPPPTPLEPGSTAAAKAVTSKPTPPTTVDAQRLLAQDRVDEAIQVLYAVRRRIGRNPTVSLLLGHAYFRKLWRSDGLREYDDAIKLAPQVRRNRLLIHNSVSALETTYKYARSVIRARIGKAAIGEVRRLARTTKSPALRIRAARLAKQLSGGGGGHRRRHRRHR